MLAGGSAFLALTILHAVYNFEMLNVRVTGVGKVLFPLLFIGQSNIRSLQKQKKTKMFLLKLIKKIHSSNCTETSRQKNVNLH